jgi:hypothetical protein
MTNPSTQGHTKLQLAGRVSLGELIECAWSIWFDSTMENTLVRMAIGAAAMFAFVALPPLAAAETVVPPGNSAATQYTETFPTTGGNAEVNSSIDGGGLSPRGGGKRSPEKVLGQDTAEKLESHGEEGRAVADLATETAPTTATEQGGSGKQGKSGANADADGGAPSANPGGGAGGDSSEVVSVSTPEGSSALSEVLGHATGSSSGEMGIFLPLVLLAVPLCALAYAWRRRHPGQATP